VPDVRSCVVSYRDFEGITHSIEVTAETLYEAAILGMKAMKVGRWRDAPNLEIEVKVKHPETRYTMSNAVLAAWLSRNGKSPKEQAIKTRLRELFRT
jgi:hypothetical protein